MYIIEHVHSKKEDEIMKDYSFGDVEYQKRFIKSFEETKDKSQIIIHLASGKKNL